MSSASKIYDPLRKEWVAALPEEQVRQALIKLMIGDLGYPPQLIVVEKGLREMPHLALSAAKVPLRRADLVCFGKGIHPKFDLYPLLLVECKAVAITDKVMSQTLGYNHYLQAYFVAVVNEQETRVGWFDSSIKSHRFVSRLPSFQQLLEALQSSAESHLLPHSLLT